jgi:hypothetical protein
MPNYIQLEKFATGAVVQISSDCALRDFGRVIQVEFLQLQNSA